MNLTDILKGALGVYRRHPGTLFLVAAPTIPLGLATVLVIRSLPDSWLLSMLVLPVVLVIPQYLPTAALVRAVADGLEGTPPEFRRSYAAAFSRLVPIVLAALRLGIVVQALFIIIVGIPLAVYFMVRWLFFQQAIMLEDMRAGEGLKRSGNIVSGSWWRVAGVVLVITIISAAPSIFLGFASGIAAFTGTPGGFGGIGLLSPLSAVSAAATSVIGALVSPFTVGAQTILFLDLRWRRTVAAVALA